MQASVIIGWGQLGATSCTGYLRASNAIVTVQGRHLIAQSSEGRLDVCDGSLGQF
jgi:hypothetical protein